MNPPGQASYQNVRCPNCGGNLSSLEGTIICPYCRSTLHMQTEQPVAQHAPQTMETGSSGSGSQHAMKFSTLVCMDQQGTGLEAFRMIIPAGWAFQGGVHWLQNNPGMPAVIAFRVDNPSGQEGFEVFPNQPFYWSNNPMTSMMFPPGSFYYGNEVRQPVNAQDTLRNLLLPRFRNVPGLVIVRQENMPDPPAIMRQNAPPGSTAPSADGARARFEYTLQNHVVEEEMYAVVEYNRIATPTMFGTQEMVFWVADYLFSFRAIKGELDSQSEMFRIMVSSFRLNPQFFNQVTQISHYMIQNQIQHIHNIGQISRKMSQMSNQISTEMMQSYEHRQQVMDKISNTFSQTIRGVDSYYDPNISGNIELPGGFTQAWSNPLGEYMISDDQNFNPNIGSNLNWTPMEKSS